MATRTLSNRKPKDYRPMLWSLARYYAKEEAKHRVKAKGERVSHYLPREITALANAILLEEPEHLVTKARETITEWMAADQKSKYLRISRSPA